MQISKYDENNSWQNIQSTEQNEQNDFRKYNENENSLSNKNSIYNFNNEYNSLRLNNKLTNNNYSNNSNNHVNNDKISNIVFYDDLRKDKDNKKDIYYLENNNQIKKNLSKSQNIKYNKASQNPDDNIKNFESNKLDIVPVIKENIKGNNKLPNLNNNEKQNDNDNENNPKSIENQNIPQNKIKKIKRKTKKEKPPNKCCYYSCFICLFLLKNFVHG
jgi:hypothetical protein